MKSFPKAYFKKGGSDTAFVDGKRVECTKAVANNESEAKLLIKDGWLTPLTECFVKKRAPAKKAATPKSDK